MAGSPNTIDLDAIRVRAAQCKWPWVEWHEATESAADVPALIAELERLQIELGAPDART